jgi:periplasmic divalent cation tolerance protein
MNEIVEISWTSGSLDEARKVARFLVQERLVACAQIVPWIESTYMWDNKLEVSQESKIVLKTRKEHFERIKDVIMKNCKYDVPEITMIKVLDGNKEYLDWVLESTPEMKKVD